MLFVSWRAPVGAMTAFSPSVRFEAACLNPLKMNAGPANALVMKMMMKVLEKR